MRRSRFSGRTWLAATRELARWTSGDTQGLPENRQVAGGEG
jgi:hypothetical protein